MQASGVNTTMLGRKRIRTADVGETYTLVYVVCAHMRHTCIAHS